MAVPGPASSLQSATQDPLRINIGSAQNHSVVRNGTPPGPKTSTGVPNGGMYHQDGTNQDIRDEPARVHPKTAPLRKDSGFKLPSIAYSPNPEEATDEEDEEEGDGDVSSAARRTDVRSTMTLAPPKLPLLFFEESSSIGDIDFAYQTSGAPSSTHSQTDLATDKSKNVKRGAGKRQEEEIKRTSSQMSKSSTESIKGETQAEEPLLIRKASPRPFTPPINTSFPKKKVQTFPKPQVQSPEKDESDTSGSHAGPGRSSFYWHSPGSGSSDEEESADSKLLPLPLNGKKVDMRSEADKEDEPPKEDGTTDQDRLKAPLVIKPIVSTIPESSLTSATALGFGGPSDWQHFNDYDAEEVDDLALYISDKPKTAELPAGTPVKEDADKLESSLSPRRLMAAERDTLPTIQERASEVIEDSKSAEDLTVKTPEHDTDERAESQQSLGKSSVDDLKTAGSSSTEREEARRSPKPQVNEQGAIVPKPVTPEQNASAPRIEPSNADQTQTKRPFPPHMQNSQARVTSNPSIQSSGLNSPIDEDDGRERIIISLQIPDSPEKSEKKKEPSPLALSSTDNQPRPRNLTVNPNLDPKIVESPDMLRTGRMSVFPQSIEMEDPYAGLDPWAKASLNRYVKLLKEEAAAETDEEKFTLFINFMDRERRNRTALYDMDEDSENESKVTFDKVTDEKGKIRSRVSLKRKVTPIIPSADTMPVSSNQVHQPVRADTMPSQATGALDEPRGSQSSLNNSERQQPPPSTAPPQQTNFNTSGTGEDAFVMVDNPNEDRSQIVQARQVKEKSSGNLVERESMYMKDESTPQNKAKGKTGLSLSALKKKALDLGGRSIAKDRGLPAIIARAADEPKKPASPITAPRETPPPAAESSAAKPAAQDKSEAISAPVDKDDKIDEAEGRQYEGDKAANRQSIYRPFSGLLRQSSVLRSSNPDSKRSSVFDRKSLAAEQPPVPKLPPANHFDKPFEDHQKPRQQPINYRYTILEPLLLVVPQEGVSHTDPPQVMHLRQKMDNIRDDFSFIHKTVLAWDAQAKKNREVNERERHTRTTQNEARIDALFNDNEIGYGDISQLEADFKRQEATRKADEDREEVGTFVKDVFDVVWARINYEMDQLQPLYDQSTEFVANASAGRTMFEDLDDAVPVAPAMEILLILYQKLMVRHQKAFEAVLERDRRLKKTEVAPWYAMGSIEKVKKIEKKYEDAEKKAILEFCRQRDERANLLMDVLDQNTLRGVGANQDYMESIMQAVRKISIDIEREPSSIAEEDAISVDEVLKAKTITTHLARSSEAIVQTFHVADMLLNAADYEVSVANAKLSNADAAAFKRLREAKAKEDNKLAMDLEHRMSLIRGDTARTKEEIDKLLALLPPKDNPSGSKSTSRENLDASAQAQDRSSRVGMRGIEEQSTSKGRRQPRK